MGGGGGGNGRNARNTGDHITLAWIANDNTRAASRVAWARVMY